MSLGASSTSSMSQPLARVTSLKVKLGLLVAASVVVAVAVATLGDAAGVPALLSIPVTILLALAVTQLLAVGMSNREIGDRLVISEATVKFHVRNLRDKLEVRRRTQIVHTATRQGIV